MVLLSSSMSLQSGSGPLEDDLDCGCDLDKLLKGPCSESDVESTNDVLLFDNFLPLEEREEKKDVSSSIVDIVVAAVAVEFER